MKKSIQEARQQIGLFLIKAMKKKGMNRSELSSRSGITREQLKWVLSGEREITMSTFLKVVETLGLLDKFCSGSENMTNYL
jgi:transcriptional regulator with XRE-family HTH domain